MSMSGKTVVVTGGSRGIGRAIVCELAHQGANVVFTYQSDAASAQKVVDATSACEGSVVGYQADNRHMAEVRSFVKAVVAAYGRIDALVNNAGMRRDRSLLYMDPSEWDMVIDVNLTGLFRMTKAVLPFMLREKKGRIVNIGSVSGLHGLSGQTNYAAAKAGLHGFTKSLAKEMARFGIRVNAVAPGPVETEMLEGLSEEYVERLLAGVPIQRLCLPGEVAQVVHFLVDEQLSPDYLTGQVLALDGGMG